MPAAGQHAGGMGPFGALTPAVEAYCAATVSCCTAVAWSLEDCEASFAEHAYKGDSQVADPEALARCIAAYSGADKCKLNVVWAACGDVLIGTRALGESCYLGNDCDRSTGEVTCLNLDDSDPYALGTCTPARHANVGEWCVRTCMTGENCATRTYGVGDICFEEDGLYCSVDGLAFTCQPLVPLGGDCSGSDEACGSGAYCETTCKAISGLSGLGGPCERACRDGLRCGDDGTCVDPSWADPEFGCKGYAPGL